MISCLYSIGFGQSSDGLIVKIIRMEDKDLTLSVGMGLAFLEMGKELRLAQADSTNAVAYESCDISIDEGDQILGQRKPKSCFEIKANDEIYYFELFPSKCSSCSVESGYGLFSEMSLESSESILLANCVETGLRVDKKRVIKFFENLLEDGILQ